MGVSGSYCSPEGLGAGRRGTAGGGSSCNSRLTSPHIPARALRQAPTLRLPPASWAVVQAPPLLFYLPPRFLFFIN